MNRNQLYTAICKTLISGCVSIDDWWFNGSRSNLHYSLGNPKFPKNCIYVSHNRDDSYNLNLVVNFPCSQYHFRIQKYV